MQVTITIRTVEQKFPGGTVGGDWFIEAALADAPDEVIHNYQGPAPSTSFDMADGDTYVIRGGHLSAGGSLLGPMASTQYTVGEDLVPIDVANTISVSAVPSGSAAAASAKPAGKK